MYWLNALPVANAVFSYTETGLMCWQCPAAGRTNQSRRKGAASTPHSDHLDGLGIGVVAPYAAAASHLSAQPLPSPLSYHPAYCSSLCAHPARQDGRRGGDQRGGARRRGWRGGGRWRRWRRGAQSDDRGGGGVARKGVSPACQDGTVRSPPPRSSLVGPRWRPC